MHSRRERRRSGNGVFAPRDPHAPAAQAHLASAARSALRGAGGASCEPLESRQLFNTGFAATNTKNLIEFDSASPGTVSSSTLITGMGAGETILSIDIRPANGILYALTGDGANVGRLYTIDTGT